MKETETDTQKPRRRPRNRHEPARKYDQTSPDNIRQEEYFPSEQRLMQVQFEELTRVFKKHQRACDQEAYAAYKREKSCIEEHAMTRARGGEYERKWDELEAARAQEKLAEDGHKSCIAEFNSSVESFKEGMMTQHYEKEEKQETKSN